MSSLWRAEIAWASLAFGVALLAGSLFHAAVVGLILFLAVYLLRHLMHIVRLERWLRAGGPNAPEGSGIWAEIYYRLYQIRKNDKRRKKHLAKMLKRFRKATSALPDATVVLGTRDEIDWFNHAAAEMLGLKKADRGQRLVSLVRHPKMVSYLEKGEFYETTGIPSPVDPAIELEIRVIPYGAGLRLLLARDVSRLRYMERMRHDFIANVSHELRTPLTVLKGYTEGLVDAGEAIPAGFRPSLQRMEEQIERMRSLIDNLLLLTRLESGVRPAAEKAVAVPETLESIRREVEALGEGYPRVALVLDTDAHLKGNENELRSAFSNLVVNAVKYTPADGEVTVRWHEDGEDLVLDVEDSGEGIAPEHLPRLTERFYRVDVSRCGRQAGTGLGLAIVKHVLSRHEAELQIHSELGRGSRFSCRFPRKRLTRPQTAAVLSFPKSS